MNTLKKLAACLAIFTLPLLAQYAPTNISVSPSSGNGNPQTFQFSASSPLGYADIGSFQVIFNSSLTAVNGCYMSYTPSSNSISLANDANNAWVGVGNLGSSGTLANSQCQLNLAASSFVGSGTTGILTLALTFKLGFLGEMNIYLATVETNTGMNNGWQQMGTFSSQLPPLDVSVSPASGTGSNQVFQFTASAAAGWQDIGTFQIIFNSTLTAVNGCYLYYTPASNLLAIANDQNTAWLAGSNLGNSGSMGNDQCQVNVQTSSFSGSGNEGMLTLSLNFLGRFSGTQNIYMATGEANSSMNTGWQQMGAWTTAAASYQGSLDVASCSTIAGWAENANQINSALTVDFYVDGASAPAFSAVANQFRQDLLNAGIGTGYYAFNLVTPAALQDGNTHSVSAHYGASVIQLGGSPKSVQCGSAPPGTINVNSFPVGLVVTVDANTNYTTPFTLNDNSSHTFSVASPQTTNSPGTEYVFANWSDGGANGHTIQPGSSVTVNFTTWYQLTLAANPSAGGTFLADLCGGCQNPTSWTSVSNNVWYPAGTQVWVTGQANSGFGFATLANGLRQQEVVMNSPLTVTGEFASNVLTLTTPTQPQVAPGHSVTAHYGGSSTASSGTTYNNFYGSDGTTLGSFSCYSIINQIDALISNITNANGNISFDVTFLSGQSATPGEYEMTCSCNYFECFVNMGAVEVAPGPAPVLQIINAATGANLTGTTQNVLVSQWIDITAVVSNANGATPTFQWTQPPGNTATDYIDTANTSTAALLPFTGNLRSGEIEFAWTDTSGTGQPISVTATLPDGTTLTAQVTYTITVPAVTVVPAPELAAISSPQNCLSYPGQWALCIGSQSGGQPGITFSATSCNSTNVNCEWMQVINSASDVSIPASGQACQINPQTALDGSGPQGGGWQYSGPFVNDTPGSALGAPYQEQINSASFSTFLMYRYNSRSNIQDGVFVPLWEMDWQWNGDAYLVSGGSWPLRSGSQANTIPGHATSNYPLWTNRFIADDATCAGVPLLSGLVVTPSQISSGASASIAVTLSAAAPANGAAIQLLSNSVAFAPQATCVVQAGQTTATCSGTAGSVSSTTPVIVTASYYNSQQTAPLTVVPAQ